MKSSIIIFNPRASYIVGGADRITLWQAKYLAKRGHKVTLVVEKRSNYSEYFKMFLENVHGIKKIKILYIEKLKELRVFDAYNGEYFIRTKIPIWSFDLRSIMDLITFIHNHDGACIVKDKHVIMHFIMDALLMPLDCTRTVFIHGYINYYKPIYAVSLKKCDKIVMTSQTILNKWMRLYAHVLKDKDVYVLRNAIDIEEVDQALNSIKKQEPQQTYDLVFVGSLMEYKGVPHLLQLIKKLKYLRKVAIIGQGPLLDEIRRMIIKLGLSNKVDMLGYVSYSTLLKILSNAKAYIHLTEYGESIPVAILESMYVGLPIITSNRNGAQEILPNGNIIVDINKFNNQLYLERIASEIDQILLYENYARYIGKRNKKVVLKHLNFYKYVIKLSKIISQD